MKTLWLGYALNCGLLAWIVGRLRCVPGSVMGAAYIMWWLALAAIALIQVGYWGWGKGAVMSKVGDWQKVQLVSSRQIKAQDVATGYGTAEFKSSSFELTPAGVRYEYKPWTVLVQPGPLFRESKQFFIKIDSVFDTGIEFANVLSFQSVGSFDSKGIPLPATGLALRGFGQGIIVGVGVNNTTPVNGEVPFVNVAAIEGEIPSYWSPSVTGDEIFIPLYATKVLISPIRGAAADYVEFFDYNNVSIWTSENFDSAVSGVPAVELPIPPQAAKIKTGASQNIAASFRIY